MSGFPAVLKPKSAPSYLEHEFLLDGSQGSKTAHWRDSGFPPQWEHKQGKDEVLRLHLPLPMNLQNLKDSFRAALFCRH